MRRLLVGAPLVLILACGMPVTEMMVVAPANSDVATHVVAPTTTTAPVVRRVPRERAARSFHRRTGCGGWEGLVGAYSWDVGLVCRIIMCESGGNPTARNPRSTARGLLQILGGSLDPAVNLAHGYAMYQRSGTRPWNSSRRCWG